SYPASDITPLNDILLTECSSERSAFIQIVSTFFRGISTAEGLRIIDDFLKRYPADLPKRTNRRTNE
ncbi:MAG: TetR/AcrR family transcriptional regulator, partial [Alistipes sp.]|nr:TetR/AcrR family transcriptional regulator [Alistipes sp.]